MHLISRRRFLKDSSLALAALAAAGVVRPSISYAAGPGANKFIILLNLVGGLDGLRFLPFHSGPVANAVNTLRPTIKLDSSRVIYAQSLPGGNARGLHDHLQTLVTQALFNGSTRIKILQQVGLPVLDMSHESAQNRYSLGAVNATPGVSKAWFAKMVDMLGFQPYQSWGLYSGAPKIDFLADSNPPLLLSSLSGYNYLDRNFPSTQIACGTGCSSSYTDDSGFVKRIHEELINGQVGTVAAAEVQDALTAVKDSIPVVANANGAAYAPTGTYSATGFGSECSNVERLIRFLNGYGPLSGSTKVIYMQRGGHDTHNGEVTTHDGTNPGGGVYGSMYDIGFNLGGLVQGLKNAGLFDRVAILTFTEFGRTTWENGNGGTDHANGQSSLLIGGTVTSGIVGTSPTVSEIQNQNWLNTSIDFRDPFSQVLQWGGLSTAGLFESYQSSGSLGLFS